MGCVLVVKYCRGLKIPMHASNSLSDILWSVTTTELELSDESTLEVLYTRFANMKAKLPHSEALMEVEECVEVLEKYDQGKISLARKRAEEALIEADALQSDYTTKGEGSSRQESRRGSRA